MPGRYGKKYIPSHCLIEKVNNCCNDSYLDSPRYARLREEVRERMAFISCYQRNHSLSFPQCDVQHGIISDYIAFCKYPCGNFPADITPGNPHLNKYLKILHRQLSSALNRLDGCWGYRGVRGYGLNYGKCHLEMEVNIIRLARKYNKALEFIRKTAKETNGRECLLMLKELED